MASAPRTTVTLFVDRPFLFVIHDVATATPLFVGRVMDPTTRSPAPPRFACLWIALWLRQSACAEPHHGACEVVEDGGVTATHTLNAAYSFDAWTVEDLDEDLPDNGMRYELVDGSLVASPIGRAPHGRAANLLRRAPDRAAPDDFVVCHGNGYHRQRPIHLLRAGHLRLCHARPSNTKDNDLDATSVLLVVEVLSPSKRGPRPGHQRATTTQPRASRSTGSARTQRDPATHGGLPPARRHVLRA